MPRCFAMQIVFKKLFINKCIVFPRKYVRYIINTPLEDP